MLPTPNWSYKCENCGEKFSSHQEEGLIISPPKCPKCKSDNVQGWPKVHRGPFPEGTFKKY